MKIKNVLIKDLQPTDDLRQETQRNFFSLSEEKLKQIRPLPQIWRTDNFLMISDGNNRVAHYCLRGKKEILVEYYESAENFHFLLEETIQIAEEFRRRGIFTPYDLVKNSNY